MSDGDERAHVSATPATTLGMKARFRPPWWAVLVTVPLTALLVSLGVWQLQRGLAKREIEQAYGQAAEQSRPIRVDAFSTAPEERQVVSATVQGRYAADRQLLLDNQPRERVPGYRVWTPMRVGEGWVVVDRGWVPANPDRARLPSVEVDGQARKVRGFWRGLPQPALRLDADPCAAQAFPRVVSYPTVAELRCVLGGEVAPGLLLLDPEEPQGFVREWSLPNPVPPSRHYGYALQWFAFAATLLFLFFKLNLKRATPR